MLKVLVPEVLKVLVPEVLKVIPVTKRRVNGGFLNARDHTGESTPARRISLLFACLTTARVVPCSTAWHVALRT